MNSGKLKKGTKRYGHLRKMAYYRIIPNEIIELPKPNEALEYIFKDLVGYFYAECIKKSVRPTKIKTQSGMVNDDFVNACTSILIEAKIVRIPRIVKHVIYKRFKRWIM